LAIHISLYHTPSPFYCFINDTAPTEIYTLSLHDALPIWHSSFAPRTDASRHRVRARTFPSARSRTPRRTAREARRRAVAVRTRADRKSTRLNSSHVKISYAVFCLKKKKKRQTRARQAHTA